VRLQMGIRSVRGHMARTYHGQATEGFAARQATNCQ
jgi:hypothetical protein